MSATGTQNPFAPPRALVDDLAEPVTLEMVPATRRSRLLAFVIDCVPGLLLGLVVGVGGVMSIAGGAGRPGAGGPMAHLGVFIGLFVVAGLGWAIYNAVLVYRYGQVFGKRVMGIRVVRTDGSRVGLLRFIFLRWLPLAILGGGLGAILGRMGHPLWSYAVGLVDVLLIFRASRLCLHDQLADTRVVTAASSESATLLGASGAHLRTISF